MISIENSQYSPIAQSKLNSHTYDDYTAPNAIPISSCEKACNFSETVKSKKMPIDHKNSLPTCQHSPKRRIKAEIWNLNELKTIFHLYEEYGSQWKFIETEFNDRPANSIKNRFYTVLRTLLKILFKEHSEIVEKLPHEIPSKALLMFYEGRSEFIKFKGLGKRILKFLHYDLDSKLISTVVEENFSEIKAVYDLIFQEKIEEQEQKSTKKENHAFINKKTFLINESTLNNTEKQIPKQKEIHTSKVNTETSESIMEQQTISPYEGVVFFFPIEGYEGINSYPYYNHF